MNLGTTVTIYIYIYNRGDYMTAKKDNENKDNLLQMAFDWIWYKIFPKPRIGTISQEELDEVFPHLPERIDYELPKKINKEGIYIPIGKTFKGKEIVLDLKSNPHTVVTGVTGAGKSVCIKEIITTLMKNYSSKDIEFYFIDLR